MKAAILLVIVFLSIGQLHDVDSQQPTDTYDYECRLKPRSVILEGTPDGGIQGPPGKRGPIGPQGEKGEKGDMAVVSDVRLNDLIGEQIQSRRLTECPRGGMSGVVTIYPTPFTQDGIKVYCDTTTDGGGWLVIQRREDGSTDFYREWKPYVHGFGSKYGEHWLGLESIHKLTSSGTYELRIDLEDFEGQSAWAKYQTFVLGDAESKYELSIGGYSGTAGDSLAYHNGSKFSTKNSDNDQYNSGNCAVSYTGAWWYKFCYWSNLNGAYVEGGVVNDKGLSWHHWKKQHYSMKFSEMKIRLRLL